MSGSMASVSIVGRLTRDAELKYTNSGEAVCHFTLATDARVKKGDQWVEEPSFWEVDLWGKRGESLNQYLTKGQLLGVSGPVRIEKSEYQGKEYTRAKVNASDIQLLGGKRSEGGNSSGGSHSAEAPAKKDEAQAGGDDFTDDIPF